MPPSVESCSPLHLIPVRAVAFDTPRGYTVRGAAAYRAEPMDSEGLRPSLRPFLLGARVARLGTVGPDGLPHLIPFCFALSGERIVSVVDRKPKRTTDLRRLRNIRADPRVVVLVDHYEENWSRIWWIRSHGIATILEAGPEWEEGIDRLVEKYSQYRFVRPTGAVISIVPERWTSWSGDGLKP